MKSFRLGITVLPGILAVIGLLALGFWLWTGPAHNLQARVPGLDRPEGGEIPGGSVAPLTGRLVQGDGKPADLAGAWPWFRGPNRDGISEDKTSLARQWPQGGPPVLWSVDLGEGHAGPAVRGGRVYVLDYDRDAAADALRCFSLADGKEIWRYSYPNDVKRNHGMSRTVPAVTEKFVVALGPKCHVTCLDAATGQRAWMIDLVRQHGATVPPWYAGQCPLVDGDRVVLAPGSDRCLLMAADLATGRPAWRSSNPRGWKMTHSSVLPMEFKGRRMYVYCGSGGVAGVSADDGSILWDTTEWKISIATVPSPLVLPDGSGRIFFSGGYNSGAMMLQLAEQGGQLAAKVLYRLKPGQFGSTQHTPIFHQGHLFGIREKDKELICLTPDGKEKWHSGSQARFGLGGYLVADGLIYVMSDDGVLTMAQAAPEAYRPLGRAQVLSGHDAWGPMALVAGRLLVRDVTRMTCLDVRKK